MDGPGPALLPLRLTVNGQPQAAMVEPRQHLADFLRETLNLTGTHLGCEQGVCGACTVLIDGQPQRACIAYAIDCDGATVTTIEGFDADPTMAALREAFSAHHALQCGFCTPGMLVTARDIVLRLGEQPERRVREELSGNLCRCTGYVGIVAAVCATAAGRAPAPSLAPLAPAPRVPAAPLAVAAPAAPPPALGAAADQPSGPEIAERFTLAASPAEVWAALADPRRTATCLPGAEITAIEGEHVTGRMRLALGPIKVSFAGEGRLALDPAAMTGRLEGGGRDQGTGSTAAGTLRWQVRPQAAGSEVIVGLSWRLTGTLAQFNRAGLTADLVRRLVGQFAANLGALLAAGATGQAPPPPPRPLGLFGLLWAVLRARLFGHRSTR
jgi:carbon-monoxide dehydrogenase small subunit